MILPESIQAIIAGYPETHYGVNTVTVTLMNGNVFSGVQVAWGSEVIRVAGYPDIPFNGSEVAAVADESSAGPPGHVPTTLEPGG